MTRRRKPPPGRPNANGTAGTATELLMAGAELSQVLERMIKRRSGLSLHQFNVLRVVRGREPDPTHASDLTRTLSMSSAHATTVVQQLEARGLVERSESTDDRRRRVVRMTNSGSTTLEQAQPALDQVERGVEGAIGARVEPAALRGELRAIRLALRQALAIEDWEDCVGP